MMFCMVSLLIVLLPFCSTDQSCGFVRGFPASADAAPFLMSSLSIVVALTGLFLGLWSKFRRPGLIATALVIGLLCWGALQLVMVGGTNSSTGIWLLFPG